MGARYASLQSDMSSGLYLVGINSSEGPTDFYQVSLKLNLGHITQMRSLAALQ